MLQHEQATILTPHRPQGRGLNGAITMILCFNAATDQTILNEETGQPVSLADAKAAWLAGDVENSSVSFQRLAMNDFDIDATMAQYRQMDPS